MTKNNANYRNNKNDPNHLKHVHQAQREAASGVKPAYTPPKNPSHTIPSLTPEQAKLLSKAAE